MKAKENTLLSQTTVADDVVPFGEAMGRLGAALLEGDDSLDADRGLDGDDELGAVVEGFLELLAELAVGDLEVVLGLAALGQDGAVAVGDVEELVLGSLDLGDVHVVGGRAEVLVLLAGEDVLADQVDLGVTVLAGLGGGHVGDLAREALEHDEAVLSQGRALLREGAGGLLTARFEIRRHFLVVLRRKGKYILTLSPFHGRDVTAVQIQTGERMC